MAKNEIYLGADVGGTKILAAVVSGSGKVLVRLKMPTPREGGAQAGVAAIKEAMNGALRGEGAAGGRLKGIGIAFPGVIEPKAGRIVFAPNMTLLTNIDLVPLMEKEYRVPVMVGNDVNLGTLGEHWMGAARGTQNAVGIFPGTGIGGGLIIRGELYSGSREIAGEIGHMIIQMDGPICGCKMKGCLEAIASRTAVERDLRDAVKAGRPTRLTDWLQGDLSLIKSSVLKRGLDEHDALVVETMRRASVVLGVACINIRHILDPEVIVLGGGMIEACGDFMLPIIEETAATDTMSGARPGGRIVRSELGDDAVFLGAVAAVRAKLGQKLPVPAKEELPAYPAVGAFSFGRVEVDGETYETDIHIRGNGKVKERKKKRIKEQYGDTHIVGVEEISKLCKGRPATLVIGAGEGKLLKLTSEAKKHLADSGIETRLLPSPEAVKVFNALGGRKALLLHVTC